MLQQRPINFHYHSLFRKMHFFPLKKFNLMKSKTNPITDMDAYNVKIGLTYPLNRSRSLHFRQFWPPTLLTEAQEPYYGMWWGLDLQTCLWVLIFHGGCYVTAFFRGVPEITIKQTTGNAVRPSVRLLAASYELFKVCRHFYEIEAHFP